MSDNTARKLPAETEPPSSPAPAATARGPTLINRLKSLLSLRAVSLRAGLQVALNEQGGTEAGDFSQSEREILQNVLKLADVRVEDVMVPRTDIQAVESSETLGALVARFRTVGHSRLPVYQDDLDNIVGFIHVKDALQRITEIVVDAAATTPVKLVSATLRTKLSKLDIVRQVVFVPPYMPVGDLLQQMRASRVHMAVVIDEYGGTDGLVTIEDLLEAVVGEIEDEHDEAVLALVRKVGIDTWIAQGRAELGEVRKVVGEEFDPGEYAAEVETLGGLVSDLAEHVPQKGELITVLPGFSFEVLQADPRRVAKVKIKRLRPAVPVEVAEAAGEPVPAKLARGRAAKPAMITSPEPAEPAPQPVAAMASVPAAAPELAASSSEP